MLDANIALFIAASLVLIATPGQDNIYIVTRGIAQGRKAALVSALGVCVGLVVHTTFAAIGLSALLARSAPGLLGREVRRGGVLDLPRYRYGRRGGLL